MAGLCQRQEKRTIEAVSPASSSGSPVLKKSAIEMEMDNEPPPTWFTQYMDKYTSDLHKRLEPLDQISQNMAQLMTKSDLAVSTANEAKAATQQLTAKVDQLSLERAYLKKEISDVTERLLKQDAYTRRDNLNFDGFEEEDNENCEKVIRQFIRETMEVDDTDMKIVRCHRQGRKSRYRGARPRTIIIRFLWFQDRQRVWAAKKKLKDSGKWIREDFPPEIEDRRKKLYPIMKAAFRDPAFKDVFMVYDKLKINGTSYGVNDMNKLPASLLPVNLSTNQDDTTLVFWSKESPFSNFHPSKFKVNGVEYACMEQYLVHKKCIEAENEVAANKVMMEFDPANQKKIGREVVLNPVWWDGVVKKILMEGLIAKFQQNPPLAKYLVDTGDKKLAEARDLKWGNGLSLFHKDALKPATWKGENLLGESLATVRTQMK
jgi:ribA/ribD-fused uncharacterized protein